MSWTTPPTFQQIIAAAKPTPEGYATDSSLQMRWSGTAIIDLKSPRVDAVEFVLGDQKICLTTEELAQRLGLKW